MTRRRSEYNTCAPFIVIRNGRFEETNTVPANTDGYVKCGNEHNQLVYVHRDLAPTYRKYVAYRLGTYHFYNKSLEYESAQLRNELTRSEKRPEFWLEAATLKYEEANERFRKAEEVRRWREKTLDRIASIEEEMDRADREGIAQMFAQYGDGDWGLEDE